MSFRALLGLCLLLGFPAPTSAQNLLQKIPSNVQQGMEAYQEERFEEAHVAFGNALTEMPSNAQLEFNQGTTLYKQGKYNEALQSLSRARDLDGGKLRGDVFYNMGNTYAAMGNTADAIASYRQALRINHQDTMARHNLEFLLSQPPPPPQETPQNNDASEEENSNTQNPPPPSADESSPPSSKPQQTKTENSPPTPENREADSSNKPNEKKSDNNRQEAASTRQREKQLRQEDADRILDAFEMDEKSYEPWRFQQKTPAEEWQYAQDW